MSLLPLVAISLLAAGEPSSLPPGHPPVDSQSLPPGHPPVDSQGLPPGHPSTAAEQQLPPGHPSLPGISTPDAQELLKKLDQAKDLKDREKSFEVAAAMGKLYYSSARYREAAELLQQAEAKAEGTRAFFLEQRRKALAAKTAPPTPEQAGCAPGADATLDALTQKAREKAKAGDAAAAAACARAALGPVLEAQVMRAKALFLSDDARGAAALYGRVLEVSGENAEALFGRGVSLLDSDGDDLKALRQARQDLSAVTKLSGTPRAAQALRLLTQVDAALAAGGLSRLNEKKAAERRAHPVQVASAPPPAMNAPFAGGGSNAAPPPLTKEMVDAVQNTERTPELEQGLAKLVEEGEEHLARGRYQEALDVYKRVVPFQPDNGRAKAGMAWALVGMNRQPMADRIWSVAVGADPKAVDALGATLKAKGDEKGAKALWAKLAETAPDYARSAGLAERIK